MKVVISGASGLIGSVVTQALRRDGHEVIRLVRREPRMTDELAWDPRNHRIDAAKLDACDAIVNLAGENVGAGRWTAKRRQRILASRVDSTRTLVDAIAGLPHPPRVLINASAIGIYAPTIEGVLTESSPVGGGFLAEVCRAWEAEALRAEPLGVRVVRLRFGVVLAAAGGALAKMLPAFRLGLGGRIGHGGQWMSWVSLPDVAGAIVAALTDERYHGALNVVAPNPVTNAEFTHVLGKVIRRPTILPIPAGVLRTVFGQMADETLLASQRAVPERLQALGFAFSHPTIESALAVGWR